MESKPRVAIIGAGLAGLSAAYHLLKLSPDTSLTIFESSKKSGGRIFTSRSKPKGEHGAEYLLGSELAGGEEYALSSTDHTKSIKDLFRDLNVKREKLRDSYPSYFWNGRYYPHRQLNSFVDPTTAKSLKKIFDYSKRPIPSTKSFASWLKSKYSLSSPGLTFIDMLLAGETCAHLTSLPSYYALGCLNSAISDTESWYRIQGGSQTLVNSFKKRLRKRNVIFDFGTTVARVTCSHKRPIVKTDNRSPRQSFDAVVITAPDGERLIGKKTFKFHSYISLLIPCSDRPRIRGNKSLRMSDAVYLSSPLNFVQFRKDDLAIRVLIPLADHILKAKWSDEMIVSFCKYFLDQMLKDSHIDYKKASVKRWPFGLPFVEQTPSLNQYLVHKRRVFFCGDRFSKWPSMAGAIVSGARTAERITEIL